MMRCFKPALKTGAQLLILCAFCFDVTVMGQEGQDDHGLTITVTPSKEVFMDDEPVIVNVALKNTSDADMEFLFEFPSVIGISFSSDNAIGVESKMSSDIESIDGHISTLGLPSKGVYTFPIALNRYFSFSRNGKHLIGFQYGSYDQHSKQEHSASGKVQIDIQPGSLSKQLVELQKALATRNKKDIRVGIESLLFWNNTRVLPALVDAASIDSNTAPVFGDEIVEAIEKFLDCSKGKEALFKVMKVSFNGFVRGLEVCTKHNIEISDEVLKHGLSTEIIQFQTLEYLLKHGNVKQVPLVEPCMHTSNATIVDMARKFLDKYSEKKIGSPNDPMTLRPHPRPAAPARRPRITCSGSANQ